MLLDIRQLSIQIETATGPVKLLDGFDLALAAGERVGLVGESGCGKSITALALMGLLPMALKPSGSAQLQGRELLTLPERDYCRLRGKQLAMVFQEPLTALNPVKTIGQQIAEGLRLHLGLSRAAAETRARRLLDRVGLPAPRFSPALYPHQLSGGQRQRVVIAIALACEPALLIADEPTTALDVVVQAQILELMLEAVAEAKMGLLLISHDLGVVASTTDRVCVMYAGRVVEQGATGPLFARMAHPYTRGLFNAMPQWIESDKNTDNGARARLNTIPGNVPEPGRRPPGCPFADRCGYVRDRCRTAPPSLQPVTATGTDRAACYFPLSQ